jgi:hypothetical protein
MEMKDRSAKQPQRSMIETADEFSGSGRRKDGAALAKIGKKQQLEVWKRDQNLITRLQMPANCG